MNLRHWIEKHPGDATTVTLLAIDLDLATRARPIGVFRADGGVLDTHRPDAPIAVEERSQAVDGRQEVAAVLLHHRQQQVAAGVTTEPGIVECRQTGQEQAASLGLVSGQGERALQHVARREHAELVAELTRAAAAVEHRDDRVHAHPGVLLEAAEQAG